MNRIGRIKKGFSSAAGADKQQKQLRKGCSFFSCAILSAFFVGIVAMGIPGFVAQKKHEQHAKCVNALQSVKAAQEKHIAAKGVYADRLRHLAMYAVPGCDDPEGLGKNCQEGGMNALSYKLKESCPVGTRMSADADSFFIYGATDGCSICLSKSEIEPPDYIGCYQKLSFEETCAPLKNNNQSNK